MVKHDKKVERYLKLIDEIEKVRTKNNVNWMDILRLAIKNSPDEAISLLKKVNGEDKRISSLFAKISEPDSD